jgi:GAF domain-containing protein
LAAHVKTPSFDILDKQLNCLAREFELMSSASARAASYVLTLEEIGHLAAEGGKPAETLMNVVALIARRFQTDVCSVYLLEPDRANLVMAATIGLRPQCIGTLRMALNEGLAGLVAELVRPVAVEHANAHPRFKYFSEAAQLAQSDQCQAEPRRHRLSRLCSIHGRRDGHTAGGNVAAVHGNPAVHEQFLAIAGALRARERRAALTTRTASTSRSRARAW